MGEKDGGLSAEDAKLTPEQLTRVIEERKRKNQKVGCGDVHLQALSCNWVF